MTDLRSALIAYAQWMGYGRGERVDAWLQRLELNGPELDLFRSLPTPACEPYRPLVAAIAPPRPDAQPAAAAPSPSAAVALERARAAADLRAFTFLPDAPPSASGGFLAGLPIAVKDLMVVRGMPFTGGTSPPSGTLATRDALAIERLRRAGAVVIGLTNLHELAYGVTSDNPHFGRVVNPVARGRIPGGSSGGSAAAIAAGIVRGAIGTDTAGSIRIPAACCGVVGFKPSYDAVPREGVLDLAPSLDHVGPLGRAVADCAALFAGLLDRPEMPAWRVADLRGRRAVRLRGYFEEPLDPAVRAALDAASAALAAEGCALVEQTIDTIETSPAIQLNTIAPEATAVHRARLADPAAQLGEDVRVRLEMGLFLPGHWYVKAQRLRTALVARLEAALERADVLLCATLRTAAPPVGATRVDIDGTTYPLHTALTQLTLPVSLAGLPAVSLPWSAGDDGAPVAVQLVGRRGEDWALLALAERLERRAPWQQAHAAY